jgi:tryptophan synthase alpha chain
MGYLNQMLAVGVEQFLNSCKMAGVKGLIIPDLPIDIYDNEYKTLFKKFTIDISFLVTPRTSQKRIKEIDRLSSGFVYLVADNSITGSVLGSFSDSQIDYFKRINSYKLKSPQLIGFGIKTAKQCNICKKYTNGAIIGSDFIRQLSHPAFLEDDNIEKYIASIING